MNLPDTARSSGWDRSWKLSTDDMYQELSRYISIDNSFFEMSFKYSINTSMLDEDTYLET